MSKRKTRLPPSATPHQAAILCVDTAERSGWAVYLRGKLVGFGEVDMLRHEFSRDAWGISGWNAERVCMHALWECGVPQSHAVLVFERPFRGTTQGQWIGAWKQAWVAQSGRKAAMVGVYPSSWRSRVLGRGNLERNEARRLEAEVAAGVIDRDGTRTANGPFVRATADAAAAIAIGQFAIYAGEVGKVMPKRPLRPVSLPASPPANDVQPLRAGRRAK